MSKLPKSMPLPGFDELRAKAGTNFERQLIKWIESLYDNLQSEHRLVRDFAEACGMQTATWRIKESNTADADAGQANAAGDLMVMRKVSGVWTSVQVYRGS